MMLFKKQIGYAVQAKSKKIFTIHPTHKKYMLKMKIVILPTNGKCLRHWSSFIFAIQIKRLRKIKC